MPAEDGIEGSGANRRPRPHPHDTTLQLFVASPPSPGLAPDPIVISISVAVENFEIEGPARYELEVPQIAESATAVFNLRGLSPGRGRIMLDFTQEGRPVGSVDLTSKVVADTAIVADAVGEGNAIDVTSCDLEFSARPGSGSAAPDVVLKVFEHRMAGSPGQLQFVLSSTLQSLADLPIMDGDLGVLDLRSEVADWVAIQLQTVGELAERPYTTSAEVEQALADVGYSLYQKLLPPALQELCWAFRKRGVKSLLVLSDDPHIPWELIKPYRIDPKSGEMTGEDVFWGEAYALSHWLRGYPPTRQLSLQRVFAVAANTTAGMTPTNADRATYTPDRYKPNPARCHCQQMGAHLWAAFTPLHVSRSRRLSRRSPCSRNWRRLDRKCEDCRRFGRIFARHSRRASSTYSTWSATAYSAVLPWLTPPVYHWTTVSSWFRNFRRASLDRCAAPSPFFSSIPA